MTDLLPFRPTAPGTQPPYDVPEHGSTRRVLRGRDQPPFEGGKTH